ncbi:MAG: hypothetical protein IJJ69_09175 [Oscillospiraceae bacterium]|nr:hypothetical protein [Oscillospiraceae bacterium]
MNGYDTGLNGLLLITKGRFEDADFTPDSGTFYIVRDTNRIFLYLGNLPLKLKQNDSGAAVGYAVPQRTALIAAVGYMENQEETESETNG